MAAIEFAIVVPVLILLVIGLFDLAVRESEQMLLDQYTRSIASNVVANYDQASFAPLQAEITDEFYLSRGATAPTLGLNEQCLCQSIVSDCYALCSDDNIPARVVSISATTVVSGKLLGDLNASSNLDVKLR
ncbi:MAG: pilus assembly protein [Gammaproteobacteria bacterium]|nr:pilus assembly protein [Gammaproteobacteria bacterium]